MNLLQNGKWFLYLIWYSYYLAGYILFRHPVLFNSAFTTRFERLLVPQLRYYESLNTELCLQQNVNKSGEFHIVKKGRLTEDEINVVCPVRTIQPVPFTQS